MNEPLTEFWSNYNPILDCSFAGKPISLERDHDPQLCRFCAQASPEVTFSTKAHAIPELLGNKALFTPNECDACNRRFGELFEDHLAKATLFDRSVAQVRGKRGVPTYDDKASLRIETIAGDHAITITGSSLYEKHKDKKGVFSCEVPIEAVSQPFVPIRASMALLKIACTLCPTRLLDNIQPTIDWLMGRANANLSFFPVLSATTSNHCPYGAGRTMLLERATQTQLPLLWCIIAYKTQRLQFFVPFCAADVFWSGGQQGRIKFMAEHYPFWPEKQGTELDVWDWSSEQETRRTFSGTLFFRETKLADRGI